jgi:hypothetical protein
MVLGWYQALWRGESVRCPSQNAALHRPSYEIPPELGALRSIYDRYLATIPLVDGVGGEIGPLDRIQLLCHEGKNIGEADMRFDTQKLEEAVGTLEGLVAEAAALR